ncbi:hypothetical protein CR513_62915, partial [Mucuna pruriens]
MAEPSERAESLLQDILWLGGSFPDLWPSKKRMDLSEREERKQSSEGKGESHIEWAMPKHTTTKLPPPAPAKQSVLFYSFNLSFL